MSIKVVLFDLDGTLLPMDQDVFVKTYFGMLAKTLAPYGYEPEHLIDAVWKGTYAMIKNNGEKSNEQVFWDTFSAIYKTDVKGDLPLFDNFYRTKFDDVKASCGFNPEAAETVAEIKAMNLRIALATNPIFPAIATESRIRWAGLKADDFEAYTTYENSHFSKPNPEYFKDVADRLGVEPKECLMVGNDVDDDLPAAQVGMKVFLLTDCLINKSNTDFSLIPNGGFAELLSFIKENI